MFVIHQILLLGGDKIVFSYSTETGDKISEIACKSHVYCIYGIDNEVVMLGQKDGHLQILLLNNFVL
jgi:hypothetical protein